MSQAKVDKYKQEKAVRRETVAKQKRNRMIMKICAGVAGLALVAWIGVSTVDFVQKNQPVKTIYTDVTAIDDYLDGLYEEEE